MIIIIIEKKKKKNTIQTESPFSDRFTIVFKNIRKKSPEESTGKQRYVSVKKLGRIHDYFWWVRFDRITVLTQHKHT